MKILFVTPAPPFPPNDGARLIVANLARTLAPEHTLYLVSFGERDGTAADMSEWFANTRIVPLPDLSKTLKWLNSLVDPLPMWIRSYESAVMRQILREINAAYGADMVHLDTVMMAQYADALALPLVMAPHDSLTLYLEQKMRVGLTVADRITARLEYPKMRRYEATQFRKAARVCVVSPREREYLEMLVPTLDVRVIPNGVDTDYFVPQPCMEQPLSIGFLGTMDYSLNRRAALYFAREVMPLIWQELPDAVFTIIGRNPTREILALTEDARLRVTGAVEDVRPQVAGQQVIVVPMREESGIKNKLLEAMAMGKPVVATPQALGGVDVRPGHELLVGTDAADLAAGCIQLLQDAALRERLGQNARAWALEHSWRRTAAQYLDLYREAIDAAAGR